jgi:hypothetical protein
MSHFIAGGRIKSCAQYRRTLNNEAFLLKSIEKSKTLIYNNTIKNIAQPVFLEM